jgi:hypothetical protein
MVTISGNVAKCGSSGNNLSRICIRFVQGMQQCHLLILHKPAIFVLEKSLDKSHISCHRHLLLVKACQSLLFLALFDCFYQNLPSFENTIFSVWIPLDVE